MTITNQQRTYLLDHIIQIQIELGIIAEEIDSSRGAKALGHILTELSCIANDLIHSQTDENNLRLSY